MKVTTTTTHSVLFDADEVKAACLANARKQAGLADDAALASSTVTIGNDGAVTVDMVEAVPNAAGNKTVTLPAPGVVVGGGVPGFAHG